MQVYWPEEQCRCWLLLLSRLQPDCFVVHKDPLSFIRFRFPPTPNLTCEQAQLFLICALEHDPVWLRRLCLNAMRYRKQHGVRVTQTKVKAHVGTLFFCSLLHACSSVDFGLLSCVGEEERFCASECNVEFRLARERVRLDRGSVTYTDELERDRVSFRYAVERIEEERAREAPKSALLLLRGILDAQADI